MRERADEHGPIAVVAPSVSRARRAATALRRDPRDRRFVAFSLDGLLNASSAPRRIVLCPAGRDVGADLAFLEDARARLLWPAPPAPLVAAVAGLLGGPEHRCPPRGAAESRVPPGLLLEGRVTARRARRALASDARIWIVESAARVRLTGSELDRLAAAGVCWFALRPARVIALLAAPALAREKGRWRHLLPPRTPVWTVTR
jgi:hypothetical protein